MAAGAKNATAGDKPKKVWVSKRQSNKAKERAFDDEEFKDAAKDKAVNQSDKAGDGGHIGPKNLHEAGPSGLSKNSSDVSPGVTVGKIVGDKQGDQGRKSDESHVHHNNESMFVEGERIPRSLL